MPLQPNPATNNSEGDQQSDSGADQPLDTFDTSKVTNMEYMFCGCESFDQPLYNFDTSKVTNMGRMFYGCTSFKQPLTNFQF